MLLSELQSHFRLTVERDGVFRSLGFVDHNDAELLVALYQGRFVDRLNQSNITCVITLPELASLVPKRLGLAIDPDPKTRFYQIHDHLCRHTDFYGPSVPTRVAESAQVHPRAFVAANDVDIGPGSLVEPHATILEKSSLGRAVVIRAGTVVGAEGFGAIRTGDGLQHVRHAGAVRIGDGAQILSNCTIVRATFGGATTIGKDTMINAQSYIAHNVTIGERCLIAAGAIIAGSAQIGNDVWIGPNAVISNGVRIGDKASVTMGAVVVRDVESGERVSGNFAMDHRRFLELMARTRLDDVD